MSIADLDTVDPKRIAEEAGKVLRERTTGEPRVPGVVAGVTTDQRTVYLEAVGLRASDADHAMTTDSVFALFSISSARSGSTCTHRRASTPRPSPIWR